MKTNQQIMEVFKEIKNLSERLPEERIQQLLLANVPRPPPVGQFGGA